MCKVGQLVWCTNNEQYIQTDYHVKCIVIGIYNRQKYIRVRIAEGGYMGNEWDVEACFFEPVQNRAKLV